MRWRWEVGICENFPFGQRFCIALPPALGLKIGTISCSRPIGGYFLCIPAEVFSGMLLTSVLQLTFRLSTHCTLLGSWLRVVCSKSAMFDVQFLTVKKCDDKDFPDDSGSIFQALQHCFREHSPKRTKIIRFFPLEFASFCFDQKWSSLTSIIYRAECRLVDFYFLFR